jgi:hypothetical protein
LQAFPSSSCSHIYVYLLSDIPVYIISFPNTYFLPTHNIFLHIYPSIPRFMISISRLIISPTYLPAYLPTHLPTVPAYLPTFPLITYP